MTVAELVARARSGLRVLEVDRAVAYTLLGRVWQVIAGPITLAFIVYFISPAAQGYFYTFSSVLALQVVFELGLSAVILQFASHEKAFLSWSENITLSGDETAKARLASLFKMALTWYCVIAISVVVLLLPAGFWFFQTYSNVASGVHWQIPWLLLVLISAVNIVVSPIISLLAGCGLVAETARYRMGQGLAISLALWMSLALGLSLFAIPIAQTAGLIVLAVLVLRAYWPALADLLADRGATTISWPNEVWPFQWRIAVSWLSGYLIFQLFNPVLFAYHGPAEAGRMGMSYSIFSTIQMMSMTWVNTRAPTFGMLIAKKDFSQLDRLFSSALVKAVVLVVLGCTMFWLIAFVLNEVQHPVANRILSPLPLGLLALTTIINTVVSSMAVYLRAHKEEPYLWTALASGVVIAITTVTLGRDHGATGMMGGYLFSNLFISLGIGTWIFASKRSQWHSRHI